MKTALVVALLALASCTRNLDQEPIKASIRAGIKAQLGIELTTVTCPEGRKVKVGDTFDCTGASTDGAKAVVKVTQKDDAGHVNWVVVTFSGKADPEVLLKTMAQQREREGVKQGPDAGPAPVPTGEPARAGGEQGRQ